MKKTSILLLTLAILFSMILPVSAAVLPFTDVAADGWYTPYVQYVYDNSLMNGTSDTVFSPDANMTRGMVVTVLYRIAGSPAVGSQHPFSDVPAGEWYESAVAWAYTNNVVNGMSETTFAPAANITREQLVTIFYRYASANGYNVSNLSNLSGYADTAHVSSYALTAFQWAVSNGIITGTDDTHLTPAGNATRAQCAAIIQRYITWSKGSSTPTTPTDPKPTTPSTTPETIPTILETVVFDEGGIKVTVLGIDYDPIYGKELDLLVENDTNKNIIYSGNNFIINELTTSAFLYVEVAAGKKAYSSIPLELEDLEHANIDDIVSFSACDAHIFDSDSFDTLYDVPFTVVSSTCDLIPEITITGNQIFNKDGIIVYSQGIEENMYDSNARFLVRNNTERDIYFDGENISVNGYTVDAYMSDIIYANTYSYCYIDFDTSSLEENRITEFNDISFTIKVIDVQTFSTLTKSETIELYIS